MTGPDESLRQSLAELADQIGPVDLYDGSLRRSRRIGRRRTAVTSAASVMLIALTGALVVRIGLPDVSATNTAQGETWPATANRSAEPARSVAGLPGALFYHDPATERLVTPTVAGPVTVVASGITDWRVDVSPDGRRIAYALAGGELRTVDLPGGASTAIARRITTDDRPAWSPDGTTLLLNRLAPGTPGRQAGTLNVATGEFTALRTKLQGSGLRWSGDGRSIVYGTPGCRLMIAAADGSGSRPVPVLGDDDRTVNPGAAYACEATSVSRGAERVAVRLHSGRAGSADGPTVQADSMVETATGRVVPPPVDGGVDAVLFRPDGTTLVRSHEATVSTLTMLSDTDSVLARVVEPPAMRDLELVAYTR